MSETVTFLTAVYALHKTGAFMMSMPHNGRLTKDEYEACYNEITGTTEDGTVIQSNDVSAFTVSYSDALAKYDELVGGSG